MVAHKKPVEQRRLTGRSAGVDAGGRRLPDRPAVMLVSSTTVPAPPESLGDFGRGVWDRLWTAGQAWLSAQTDLDVMRWICEGHDEREALRVQIAQDGYLVAGSMGQLRPNPLLGHLRALEEQMTKWMNQCGFNPSARSQLGCAEVKAASKLDEMIARRRAQGRS